MRSSWNNNSSPTSAGESRTPASPRVVRSLRGWIDGLTRAAAKAQWLLMVTHLVYAVLAIVLAAMAVLAIAAISKIEEPRPQP